MQPGDHGMNGDGIEKRIESNKLRLVYQRRPCADILDAICSEPDPPAADFPNGWGGFADLMHVDFKIPAEHRINGEIFDAEMQIYHLHAGRRRLAAISVLIRVDPFGYNAYLQTALDAFQYEYNLHRAQCSDSIRRGRKLVTEFHSELMGDKISNVNYDEWGDYSTLLEDPDFIAEGEEHKRRMQSRLWYPHHEDLIPTYWFYGYDGSLTEPPCSEIVSWFVMDRPMIIGPTQLEQMKTILFSHTDANCQKTSVHDGQSVARPIQESSGRQVWHCNEANFPPDSERVN
jgi:carbonic anhydrase